MQVDTIVSEEEALRQSCQELADSFDELARQLEESGKPASDKFLQNIQSHNQRHSRLSDQLDSNRDASNLLTLTEIQGCVRSLRAELPEVKWIERLLRLQTANEIEGWERIQTAAANFKVAIIECRSDDEFAMNQLSEGTHPWCALVQLAEDHEELGDDDWQEAIDYVREHLGVTIATAIQRGKISSTIAEPRHREAESVSSLTEPLEISPPAFPLPDPVPQDTSPESIDEQESVTSSIFGDAISVVPNSESVPQETGDQESTEDDRGQNALFDDEEGDKEDNNGCRSSVIIAAAYENPDQSCRQAALEVLASNVPAEDGTLGNLVRTLLRNNRNAVAGHLASCESQLSRNSRQWLSPPLIRLWTLCHSVIYPRGQMSGRIAKEFGQLKRFPTEDFQPQQRLAYELFVRAVSLRPSIIAPETGAVGFLRKFSMRENLTNLYNFCARIGSYSERIGGLPVASLQDDRGDDQPTKDLEALYTDIAAWRARLRVQTFDYGLATPLFYHAHWSLKSAAAQTHPEILEEWQQWTETSRQIDRLLGPVMENDRGLVNQVRHESERLSMSATSVSSENQQNWMNLVRAAIRQAVSFAQRWATIVSSSSGQQQFVSQDVADLTQEIEQRHSAVIEEIEEVVRQSNDDDVALAAACLMLSIDDVVNLFKYAKGRKLDEADPRHLLNAELLKLPGLPLDSQWEPDVAPDQLMHRLVRSLVDPSPNWEMAIRLNVGLDNNETVERILSLNHWTAEQRRLWQLWVASEKRHHIKEQWPQQSLVLTEPPANVEGAGPKQDSRVMRGLSARIATLRRELDSEDDVFSDVPSIHPVTEGKKNRASVSRPLLERLKRLEKEQAEESNEGADSDTSTSEWIMDLSDDLHS